MARDEVLKSWPFRMVGHPAFAVLAQFISYAFVWVLVRDWRYALALWAGIRVFATGGIGGVHRDMLRLILCRG